MGIRKHNMAERMKEEKKSLYIASLRNCPTSPRKMRLVADLVRGMDVAKASAVLQFTKKHAARDLEKLLRSAISNFEQKSGERWEEADLNYQRNISRWWKSSQENSTGTSGTSISNSQEIQSCDYDFGFG